MGFFSSITDAIGLTDSGAGADAAQAASAQSVAAQRRAREELVPAFDAAREQLLSSAGTSRELLGLGYDQSSDLLSQALSRSTGVLQPLASAATQSLGYLQAGATPEGYAANIQGLSTGGALDPLVAENRRNLEAELAAQGLTRSGSGISDMSRIPIETIMGIESQLYGRQGDIAQSTLPSLYGLSDLESSFGRASAALPIDRANTLYGLESGLGSNLANLDINRGQNLADIERGIGQTLSSGILTAAQADAADRAVLGEVLAAERGYLHDFGMSMMGSMGGGMGGG